MYVSLLMAVNGAMRYKIINSFKYLWKIFWNELI